MPKHEAVTEDRPMMLEHAAQHLAGLMGGKVFENGNPEHVPPMAEALEIAGLASVKLPNEYMYIIDRANELGVNNG